MRVDVLATQTVGDARPEKWSELELQNARVPEWLVIETMADAQQLKFHVSVGRRTTAGAPPRGINRPRPPRDRWNRCRA